MFLYAIESLAFVILLAGTIAFYRFLIHSPRFAYFVTGCSPQASEAVELTAAQVKSQIRAARRKHRSTSQLESP